MGFSGGCAGSTSQSTMALPFSPTLSAGFPIALSKKTIYRESRAAIVNAPSAQKGLIIAAVHRDRVAGDTPHYFLPVTSSPSSQAVRPSSEIPSSQAVRSSFVRKSEASSEICGQCQI